MEYETYRENGAQEKTRTSTTVKGHRHLKPTRLPIPPPGQAVCPYYRSRYMSTLRGNLMGYFIANLTFSGYVSRLRRRCESLESG